MLPIAKDFWPGRPILLKGESFSSWFVRVAAANGLRPAELYRIVQPGGDRSPRDLDRYADIHLLSMMSDKTGISVEALEQSSFRRWSGTAYERDDGLVKFDWLPPAGREKAKRCFGQQLCPLCLAEDAVPYLRLEWRLSFITVCPKHQRLLLDRCPAGRVPKRGVAVGKRPAAAPSHGWRRRAGYPQRGGHRGSSIESGHHTSTHTKGDHDDRRDDGASRDA